MSLSLQGEQLTVFIANGKLRASKKILEVWKILSATVVWQLVKDFLDETGSDIMADFFHIV